MIWLVLASVFDQHRRERIEQMEMEGYWSSPGGQTPGATLYSAIIREIATKGKEARFKKTQRGKFSLVRD